MYYTKDGKRSLYPQTHEDRYRQWLQKISNGWNGIPEPTEMELRQVYEARCRYWRAARASLS